MLRDLYEKSLLIFRWSPSHVDTEYHVSLELLYSSSKASR